MAKKQCRYYSAEIEKAFPQLKGQVVNIILHDGQVHYLKLISLTKNQLEAIDGTALKHYFPLHLVDEIIAEKHA